MGKPIGRTDSTKPPSRTGRASGYPPRAVTAYRLSKQRFLAAQKKGKGDA